MPRSREIALAGPRVPIDDRDIWQVHEVDVKSSSLEIRIQISLTMAACWYDEKVPLWMPGHSAG